MKHTIKAHSQAQGLPWASGQPLSEGQGAIEYLLIIGAAVLVVAIAILAIASILQQGQDQSTTSGSSAMDALHDLAVGGMGYKIEFKLNDGSSGTFPVPSSVICKDPTDPNPNGKVGCFYVPTIVHLIIGEDDVSQYDLTGIREPTLYTYTYKGDPNTQHRLRLTYDDCWAGTAYATGNPFGQINTYLNGLTNADLFPSPNAKVFKPFFIGLNNSSDQDNNTTYMGSMCNDNNLWDKNVDLNYLKIVKSDGTEAPLTYERKYGYLIVDTNFQ